MGSIDQEHRPCTCHPGERPVRCQRRYAFTECQTAAALEDFDIQVEAARRSFQNGYYATANAELRGAMLAVDAAERLRAVTVSVHGGDFVAGARAALEGVQRALT